ncbi:hypothetical protein ETD86_37285 [Nonomuraea turkmeniaca]|uniref:Toxin n=1 Tax=Nonomuraea turkmeniaca TaxID=103838 RepID=A0A5S4F488_9ACTN|nr:hypothetical protein [Nonomuraea turkmeniaca]TMR10973.1 hypothetical protein ETD86_37285 [Nonomuraea turkmeniaca]
MLEAPIPYPFTLDAFLDRIRDVRQRPLHMHDLPDEARGAVTGLWLGTKNADHLFVDPGASGLLRVNIALHEVSHMLLKHGRVGGDAEVFIRRMLGPIMAAGRGRYETEWERDAEKLAALILTRAHTPPPQDGDEGLHRLSRTFGYES